MQVFSSLPVRRVQKHPSALESVVWPATLPAVRQVLDEGWDLGPVSVITGENGSGKSTLLEAIALSYGLNAEGGSTGAMHSTRVSESDLSQQLQLVRGAGASKRGFFLRAETMHGFFTYLEDIGLGDADYHERSRGESFLDIVVNRSRIRGLWLLDEPESALSVSGCLALIGQLRSLVAGGSQVILSTHSPVLAALPGADLYELGEWGLRRAEYDALDLVRTWRGFLGDPQRYLRHLD
ncbi:AAA family ATPase [Rathayibacter sp. VKM Ac-2927]|nr:AAA family ATPase [Rathayibacter sp. VKM Ac-2927]